MAGATQRRRRAAAALLVAGVMLTAGSAEATVAARSTRFGGQDRFETARLVAEATFTDAPVALLANGRSYADALSASYVSGGLRAPILLTETDDLPDAALRAFERLGTSRVLVIGGPAAVSERVRAELEDAGMSTSRISGESRYHTAREVAGTFAADTIGEIDGGRAAIVVTGEAFADALSVAPISSSRGAPILLTTTASLHEQARDGLRELGIRRVVVVGGSAAVADAVVAEIRAMGIGVRRIAGATRQDTAIEVAQFAAGELDYPMNRVLLTRGDTFADALAAGTRGGRLQAPVLLVAAKDVLGSDLRSFIGEHVDTLSEVDVLGGTGVIEEPVAEEAVEAARGR